MNRFFAVLDREGELCDVFESLSDAESAAFDTAKKRSVYMADAVFANDISEATPNAVGTSAAKALRMAKLPVVTIEDMRRATHGFEDFTRAHAALRPYFPKRSKSYDTPLSMADQLLAQNYKMEKQVAGYDAIVFGLSLAPFWKAFDKTPGEETPPRGVPNLCIGSNGECRAGCLVATGQNVTGLRGMPVKFEKTRALLERPVEFCSMLWLSMARLVSKIVREGKRAQFKPSDPWELLMKMPMDLYVRLNVYSDIPWELFCPGLFDLFPQIQFYDYTKVAGRHDLPDNYDLTFSYSGTNEKLVHAELAGGRRVTAVFMWPRHKRFPPGLEMWGHKVVEGDYVKGPEDKKKGVYPWGGNGDMRPMDPSPCVIGLRFKRPAYVENEAVGSFVIPVEFHNNDMFTVPSNAEQSHAGDFQEQDD
jgi:hypothetical protein